MAHKTSTSEAVESVVNRIKKLAEKNGRHPRIDPHPELEVLDKLKVWGVPRMLAEVAIGEVYTTNPLAAVKRWVESSSKKGWCLVLSSQQGAGKSMAAAWWLSEIAKTVEVSRMKRWWSSSEIARASTYDQDFVRMFSAEATVVDDLGAEYLDKNGNFLTKFDEIIDCRYANFRKTIITTNLNAAAFKDRYGKRVADRIRDGFHGGGAFVEFSDESLRGNDGSRQKQKGKGK